MYLGLDLSTQGLKALCIDSKLQVVFEESVQFDVDLKEYGTTGGALKDSDGLTVTAPSLMFVAAFDKLLLSLKAKGLPLNEIKCISGAGQQHGGVFWAQGADNLLSSIDSKTPLTEQLAKVFSLANGPIWMDSSTGAECAHIEQVLGGPQKVADISGSRACERFTGPQIRKYLTQQPEIYANTERIGLISSLIPSLLLGSVAPIDQSDASGMTLLDLKTADWSDQLLAATAGSESAGQELKTKLGPPAPCDALLGFVQSSLCERYGFNPDCQVTPFTGDNPSSLAGLVIQAEGDVCISLGSSDTLFGILRNPSPAAAEGHVFVSPTVRKSYMVMQCYKNGSLTREHIRDNYATKSDPSDSNPWAGFDTDVQSAPLGTGDQTGFFFKEPEVTPLCKQAGIFVVSADGKVTNTFSDPSHTARACLESRALSLRSHCASLGLQASRVLATGGASANTTLLQMLADVFGCNVHASAVTSSAAMGGAYRALYALQAKSSEKSFGEVLVEHGYEYPGVTKTPNADNVNAYTQMVAVYAQREETLLNSLN